jgi:type VI secretion system VasD/TssJ family lipoprotein
MVPWTRRARMTGGIAVLFLCGWAVLSQSACALPPIKFGLRGTPDQNNGGYAVQISVYQLKKDTNFIREPLESFWQEKGKGFESDLVAPPVDIILAPNDAKTILIPIFAETEFIGIAADFRKPDLQGWRHILPLPARGLRELLIQVGKNGLRIESAK